MRLVEKTDDHPAQQPEIEPFQTAGRLTWGLLKRIKVRMQEEDQRDVS